MHTTTNTMQQLREIDFMIHELVLYLDTHPTNTEAFHLLKTHIARRAIILKAAEKQYGPITANANTNNSWQWIHNPWPWDKED